MSEQERRNGLGRPEGGSEQDGLQPEELVTLLAIEEVFFGESQVLFLSAIALLGGSSLNAGNGFLVGDTSHLGSNQL